MSSFDQEDNKVLITSYHFIYVEILENQLKDLRYLPCWWHCGLSLTLALDIWKKRLRKRNQVEVVFHFQKLSGKMGVGQTWYMYDRKPS